MVKVRVVKTKMLGLNPLQCMCQVGGKVGGGFRFGDLTIVVPGIPRARISINGAILKEALLGSPDILEELGLKVSQIVGEEPAKEQPISPPFDTPASDVEETSAPEDEQAEEELAPIDAAPAHKAEE